jgi:hypothetical protein
MARCGGSCSDADVRCTSGRLHISREGLRGVISVIWIDEHLLRRGAAIECLIQNDRMGAANDGYCRAGMSQAIAA